MENKGNLDFSSFLDTKNISKVNKNKNTKEKKQSVSYRPLYITPSPNDSLIKTFIIGKINERQYTYNDLYEYCINLRDGDIYAGKRDAANIINGLKNCPSMYDTRVSLLCDFLKLDIKFVDRVEDTEDNDED